MNAWLTKRSGRFVAIVQVATFGKLYSLTFGAIGHDEANGRIETLRDALRRLGRGEIRLPEGTDLKSYLKTLVLPEPDKNWGKRGPKPKPRPSRRRASERYSSLVVNWPPPSILAERVAVVRAAKLAKYRRTGLMTLDADELIDLLPS